MIVRSTPKFASDRPPLTPSVHRNMNGLGLLRSLGVTSPPPPRCPLNPVIMLTPAQKAAGCTLVTTEINGCSHTSVSCPPCPYGGSVDIVNGCPAAGQGPCVAAADLPSDWLTTLISKSKRDVRKDSICSSGARYFQDFNCPDPGLSPGGGATLQIGDDGCPKWVKPAAPTACTTPGMSLVNGSCVCPSGQQVINGACAVPAAATPTTGTVTDWLASVQAYLSSLPTPVLLGGGLLVAYFVFKKS